MLDLLTNPILERPLLVKREFHQTTRLSARPRSRHDRATRGATGM